MNRNTNLQIFIVIVDQRDADLFSVLENNHNQRELVWGLRKKDFDSWIKINRGDIICMMLENNTRFLLCGKISKTDVDTELPKKWGQDVRTLQMTHMVYFTRLQKLHRSLDSVQRRIIENKISLPGVYQIPENDIKTKKPVGLTVDLEGPPARIKCNVVRFIRDTQKSRRLKKIYENRCQICGYQLEIGEKVYYSEVHHLRPLNEGGDDDFNNMVVLCPTHHAEFDYGVICIDEDLTHVIDKNFDKIGTITMAADHVIRLANIKHNLKRVCN